MRNFTRIPAIPRKHIMTTHNSIQNLPTSGVNNSTITPSILVQNENISCLTSNNKRNEILLDQLLYLNRLMMGYHQFIDACFLSHPDLHNLSLSTEAIQSDIDKRLKDILTLISNH